MTPDTEWSRDLDLADCELCGRLCASQAFIDRHSGLEGNGSVAVNVDGTTRVAHLRCRCEHHDRCGRCCLMRTKPR